MIDEKLKEICNKMNRESSERHVKLGDDLQHIRTTWDIIVDVQQSDTYKGEYISLWSFVEDTITDKYLDLLQSNDIAIGQEKRIESLMFLYSTVMGYIHKKMNNMQPGDLERYLTAHIPKPKSSQ